MKYFDLIKLLRKRLSEYEENVSINADGDIRRYFANLNFALALFEQAIVNQIPVSKENEFFFTGQYHISRFLCEREYEEIGRLYDEMASIIKDKNYFRSGNQSEIR